MDFEIQIQHTRDSPQVHLIIKYGVCLGGGVVRGGGVNLYVQYVQVCVS